MKRNTRPRKRFTPLVALLGAVALLLSILGIASPASAEGNAGTIKVHAFGSEPGTESNEPKVCAFNLEFYGFDEGFDGYVEFDVQGGDGPTGVAAGPFEVGTANADGYFESGYFNVEGGPTIQNGHYKVTLYGKFNDGRINYEDVKAKSKVFKVDCPPPPPPPTPVSPTAPTPSDVCEPATGPTNDRISIPSDANFTYQVDGKDVVAGPFVATGTSHTVKAVAKEGVVIAEGAKTEWTFQFTKVVCVTPPPPPPPVVTPPVVTPPEVTPPKKVRGAVKSVDKCRTAGDRFAVRKERGVVYYADGQRVREGVWLKTGGDRKIVVKAKAASKRFKVVGQDRWVLRFTNKPCGTPTVPVPTGMRMVV